jgi:hypothetical protein
VPEDARTPAGSLEGGEHYDLGRSIGGSATFINDGGSAARRDHQGIANVRAGGTFDWLEALALTDAEIADARLNGSGS